MADMEVPNQGTNTRQRGSAVDKSKGQGQLGHLGAGHCLSWMVFAVTNHCLGSAAGVRLLFTLYETMDSQPGNCRMVGQTHKSGGSV